MGSTPICSIIRRIFTGTGVPAVRTVKSERDRVVDLRDPAEPFLRGAFELNAGLVEQIPAQDRDLDDGAGVQAEDTVAELVGRTRC